MLMVLFYVGEERYACVCDPIVEIIPRVPLRKIARVEDYVSGVLNYGGVPIPVVDFCQLCVGRPCKSYLSTRIIILRQQKEGEPAQMLGLMAERITDTMDRDLNEFASSGFSLRSGKYIGGVVNDQQGLIYHVLIDKLFETIHGVFSEA